MKPTALIVGLGITLTCATAAAADIADFLRDIGGKNEARQAGAAEGAAQYGPEAVLPLVQFLDSHDPAAIRSSKIALERIAGVATRDECARGKFSRAVCEALSGAKQRECRDWLMWLLSYAGGPEAVRTLSCLLPNPDAFDMAVFALQSIGGEDAARALLGRLACECPARKITIITALGVIASAKPDARPIAPCCCGEPRRPVCLASLVTPALLLEARQYSCDTANAAVDALGRIGASSAEALVWRRIQAHPDDVVALNAYLKIAEKRTSRDAASMYAKLLRIAVDHYAECAALHGLGQSGGAHVVPTLVRRLDSEQADVRGAAEAALKALHGPQVDAAIQRAATKADPKTKEVLSTIVDARKKVCPKAA